MRVINRNGDHYEVDSMSETTKHSEFYHVTSLRLYLSDDQFEDSEWVARRDHPSATVVYRIIDHEGDELLKSTLSFRCRWEGFEEDAEKDRWIPYRELRDNPKLHEYLRSKELIKLIPDEHKFPNEFPIQRPVRERRPRPDPQFQYGHAGRKRRQL
jgi:hypothetical protein